MAKKLSINRSFGNIRTDGARTVNHQPKELHVTASARSATLPGPDYRRLIEPARVHGSLYTDPRIFADELARIWHRTWVFVGHASEVAQPGDYIRTSIGLQDVIMTRGADDEVHLLLNR